MTKTIEDYVAVGESLMHNGETQAELETPNALQRHMQGMALARQAIMKDKFWPIFKKNFSESHKALKELEAK